MFCDPDGPQCLRALVVLQTALQRALSESHCIFIVAELKIRFRDSQCEHAANCERRITVHQTTTESENMFRRQATNFSAILFPFMNFLLAPPACGFRVISAISIVYPFPIPVS